MDIVKNWDKIRLHFKKTFSTSMHVAIASVDDQGQPTTTPIGTFFLNKDQTGFYFEKYTTKLPLRANANKNICVLGVHSSKWFWLKSLFKGKFSAYPAVKLYGQLGVKRKASPLELRALKRRMRATKRLKGHQILWSKMDYVRELSFSKAEKINLPVMTENL